METVSFTQQQQQQVVVCVCVWVKSVRAGLVWRLYNIYL